MINLDAYTSVKTHLYVSIQIDEYRTGPLASYTPTTLRFSDDNNTFTIDGNVYTPLGRFLAITGSTSELRSSGDTCTISIGGVPNSAISEIVYSKMKGAPVKVYRAYFNASTGVQIGTTVGRFIGSINNYSLAEEFDVEERTSTNIIQIECSSSVTNLENKVAGRRTNPQSMQTYFSSDTSFDSVPTLKGKTFNFGAAQ